jgi:hypothetical protein
MFHLRVLQIPCFRVSVAETMYFMAADARITRMSVHADRYIFCR